MNKKIIAMTLGIMCILLTVAISVQLKTIESTNTTVSQSLTDNDLRDQVLKWKEKYDNILKEFSKSEETLENTRTQATQNDTDDVATEEQITKNNVYLGLTDVKGSGVVISLEDNQNVTTQSISALDNIEYYLVHYSDLLTIVNELKNAGAEAISVNGQRIVTTTSITCEGNVIKINGEKIGTPFEIKAIGSPELLYGALSRPGGYLELLDETGVITSIKKSELIIITKYTGAIKSQYMQTY